ncbi:hypothetical protein DL766_008249 [Monosporascus sp. MC13-8B]|uniref:Uncharacterized protein n=1 Tax=Monosporascus cannonballus TaxID=155416 RepID=A0ABY0GU64_9PEZI|nr:hypothetical protein DL762_010632 [Monosporascus cannonballus]RYO76270.1 hypothetical protein DL763_010610 [Monosporascus cannonballus]RYP20203.1 hypothetical protein DL766_008249 [Monosporascus sp. MC13-8B]
MRFNMVLLAERPVMAGSWPFALSSTPLKHTKGAIDSPEIKHCQRIKERWQDKESGAGGLQLSGRTGAGVKRTLSNITPFVPPTWSMVESTRIRPPGDEVLEDMDERAWAARHAEAIHGNLPSPTATESGRASAILACYTQLSRTQGSIGGNIYRTKQQFRTSLSESVKRVMRTLLDWFRRLPDEVRRSPLDLGGELSRESISICPHYYHCFNMAARPLLLYAVQRQIAANASRPNAASWEGSLPPNAIVITYAARSSGLRLTAAIGIRSYGFNHGEQAFSAALLVTVNIAFPFKETDALATGTALPVLQSMAKKEAPRLEVVGSGNGASMPDQQPQTGTTT